MAINFPDAPSLNQEHTVGSTTWKWDGTVWNALGVTVSSIVVADESADTTCFPLFATAATGAIEPKTGTNLTFDSSTGALVATSVAGDGSGLTAITAANISSGNLGSGVLPYVNVSGTSVAYKMVFANTTTNTAGNYQILMDSLANLTYNPSTNQLAVGTITTSGNVTIGGTNPTLEIQDAGDIHFRDDVGTTEGIHFNVSSITASNPILDMTSTALNPQLHLKDGAWFRIYDGTNVDYVDTRHDGTDLNTIFSGTTDWNINGNVVLDGPVTTADQGTGAQVKDGLDNAQPVGFNVIPPYEIDVADTFDLAHNGMMWHRDGTATIAFTCDSDTNIPVGATYMVANENATGALTIAQGTATIRWFEGTGTPTTGTRTLAEGGIATVYKYADAEFWVWGSGIT